MAGAAEQLDTDTSSDDTLEEGAGAGDEENLDQDANLDTNEDDTTDDNEVNLLDMSDDDFAKALMDDFVAEPDADDKTKKDTESSDEDDSEKKTEEDSDDDEKEEEESEDVDTSKEEDLLKELDDTTKTDTEDKTDDDSTQEADSEKKTDSEETQLSPEDSLAKIYSPFRANGKDMSVKNPDDVRQLMQMGANYNKKMAALKPNLRLMKMLQNNDLLDEGKLSFLIDLDKKNPEAIKKLVKDANIDSDDLDNDADINYKPNTYTVNDQEIELDETLNDIRDTKSFATTLDVIGNKWDAASRAAILENPAAIRVLNDHVSSGIYDKITAAVETERMFNRIPSSMSDLEAYKHVGDLINSQGGFRNQTQSTSTATTVVKKAAKKEVDTSVSERKKAAASTKGSPKTKVKGDFNPLAMSDEEFEKTGMDKFV